MAEKHKFDQKNVNAELWYSFDQLAPNSKTIKDGKNKC